jgi:hypothetical protein
MKAAVGIGGSAEDGTIEAEWRFARATGLAAVDADERAMLQAFPDTATDHIPLFEQILKISPPVDASDQERRDANTIRYQTVPDATHPGLLADLIALDSRISILPVDEDETRDTQGGRFFEPHLPLADATDPPYNVNVATGGTRSYTDFPNYSDRFVLYVFFDIGSGNIPDGEEEATTQKIKDLLNTTLPAWCSFRIIYDTTDFILDTSLLDLGTP